MGNRVRFLVTLSMVALAAAGFAIAFRRSLALWYGAAFDAANVVDAMRTLPWWARFGLPVAGGMAAGLMSRLRASHGQGVSNVMEAVALGNVQLSLRTTVSRVLSSGLAIASGMFIGREGPLIEFGGSIGAAFGRLARASTIETRVLVAAGTAAGFASAYNTPFAAVLFVFETILGIAALDAILPTIGATVIATTLTRLAAGEGPIYGQRSFVMATYAELAAFARAIPNLTIILNHIGGLVRVGTYANRDDAVLPAWRQGIAAVAREWKLDPAIPRGTETFRVRTGRRHHDHFASQGPQRTR